MSIIRDRVLVQLAFSILLNIYTVFFMKKSYQTGTHRHISITQSVEDDGISIYAPSYPTPDVLVFNGTQYTAINGSMRHIQSGSLGDDASLSPHIGIFSSKDSDIFTKPKLMPHSDLNISAISSLYTHNADNDNMKDDNMKDEVNADNNIYAPVPIIVAEYAGKNENNNYLCTQRSREQSIDEYSSSQDTTNADEDDSVDDDLAAEELYNDKYVDDFVSEIATKPGRRNSDGDGDSGVDMDTWYAHVKKFIFKM